MTNVHSFSRADVTDRIAAIRRAIETDGQDPALSIHRFVMIGDIGANNVPDSPLVHQDVRNLAEIANGMRCGSFFIYGGDDTLRMGRHYAEMLDEGPEKWQAIGEINEVPVFLERATRSIWFAPEGGPEEFMDMPMVQVSPDIWSFIGWYVTGPGYLDPMFGLDDDWAHFLRNHGFFDGEDPE